MQKRINEYKNSKDGAMFAKAQKEVQQIMNAAEESRDLTRTWVHFDMDAFYAAVEIRDDPKLAEVPLAIGSESMISTANYEARKFGVRSAMPGFIAKKLCPHLVFKPVDSKKYQAVA